MAPGETGRTRGSQTRIQGLYERTVSNLDSQAPSIDARGALLYITIPALSASLSFSYPPTQPSVSLLRLGFQPMPPFDIGPVPLSPATWFLYNQRAPFEIYLLAILYFLFAFLFAYTSSLQNQTRCPLDECKFYALFL